MEDKKKIEEKKEVMDINPTRLENESFEDYKERRKKVSKVTKEYLKGRIFWPGNFPPLSPESWDTFMKSMLEKEGGETIDISKELNEKNKIK